MRLNVNTSGPEIYTKFFYFETLDPSPPNGFFGGGKVCNIKYFCFFNNSKMLKNVQKFIFPLFSSIVKNMKNSFQVLIEFSRKIQQFFIINFFQSNFIWVTGFIVSLGLPKHYLRFPDFMCNSKVFLFDSCLGWGCLFDLPLYSGLDSPRIRNFQGEVKQKPSQSQWFLNVDPPSGFVKIGTREVGIVEILLFNFCFIYGIPF